MPAAPDLARVRFGRPISLLNGKDLQGWRLTDPNAADEWKTMDITLVDRHVTVILNGTKIIDNQPVLGPTGGALWSDPLRPGPIYLQGDHLAVRYRNMVIRLRR